jgi:hypothetical protein
MTLSHEILHAHVTAVLAAIFASPDQDLPEDARKEFLVKYEEAVLHKQSKPHHFIDSLRSILYHYAVLQPQYSSTGEDAALERASRNSDGEERERDIILPNSHEDIMGSLNDVFHEINELLVHVLDYHYFYDCNDRLFLGLLWESWWSVPKVLNEVEQYIFRSLVAVASGEEKIGQKVLVRFNNAVKTLDSILQQLIDRNPENVLVSEALNSLKKETVRDILLSKFHIGIYLADMVRSFIWSKNIHGALYRDDNCTKNEGIYYYQVETCEFRDIDIQSPVALIADRLRNALVENETMGFSPQHRAAWLQLACASYSYVEDGGLHVP